MENNSPIVRSPFTRSSTGILGGVCKGLAQRFDVDVLWMRLGFLIAFLFFGTGCGVYLLLLVSLPREDRLDWAHSPRIFGVCARLAQRLQFDVGIVRAVALLFLFLTFGATFVLYCALFFLLPAQQERINS